MVIKIAAYCMCVRLVGANLVHTGASPPDMKKNSNSEKVQKIIFFGNIHVQQLCPYKKFREGIPSSVLNAAEKKMKTIYKVLYL